MYERNWHGIDMTTLPAAQFAREAPPPPEFFDQFYQKLAETGRGPDPAWLASKRALGELLLARFIRPWAEKHGRAPRILALSVGLGHAEGVWLEAGCNVTLHECQEASLAPLRARFPTAPCLVGDLATLRLAQSFDIITLVTVTYYLPAPAFRSVLATLRAALSDQGQILLYEPCVLSWRKLAAEAVKTAIGYYRRTAHVFWGWWRSPAIYLSAARAAGLRAEAVCRFSPAGLVECPALTQAWPALRASDYLFVFRPA